MCVICGKRKLGNKYDISGHEILICGNCLKYMKYNVLEFCPNCGRLHLVPTDEIQKGVTTFECHCNKCLEGK